MTAPLPETLTKRLAEAETAATIDRRPKHRDWLVLGLSAIAAPALILLAGWAGQ